MMTRREMNGKLAVILGALPAAGSGGLLRAEAPPAPQNAPAQARETASIAVNTLMQEPLAPVPNQEVTVITLTVAPGGTSSPHRHTGPVFAYVLEGEIENQVDPEPPRKYKPGEFFYEPAMHVHRTLRNLSGTEAAKLLIFEVGEKGKKFTIGEK